MARKTKDPSHRRGRRADSDSTGTGPGIGGGSARPAKQKAYGTHGIRVPQDPVGARPRPRLGRPAQREKRAALASDPLPHRGAKEN
ncbi:hypothetical protein GCM10010420_10920 [Streptomyces glaucosporus]|uniref:23S rRNA (Guanosine(2251)-2'-O)-methyltransferase RlmB n=1 Tax=Streptomyces glaucosporus TaxID=284044 RepID=A0ABN3HWR7_9ACTN